MLAHLNLVSKACLLHSIHDYMPRTAQHARAFHFCKNLFLLLATSLDAPCKDCSLSSTYLAYDASVVRKRRVAKPKEVFDATRPPSQRPVAFSIAQGRTAKHKSHSWTADSGATIGVTNRLDIFETIDDVQPRKRVRVANNDVVDVVCTGTVRLNMVDKNGQQYTVLHSNVCYSPRFSCNLLSIQEMYRQHRMSTVFRGNHAAFMSPDGHEIPISFTDKKQYILHAHTATVDNSANARATLWHKRLMHCGNAAMQRISCVVPGFKTHTVDFSRCDACLQGGATKLQVGKSSRRPRDQSFGKVKKSFTFFGERISCDLCGPFPTSLTGDKYAIVFHDSYTKYVAVYTIPNKEKETVVAAFQLFITNHEEHLPHGVKQFWTDNGSEFCNSDMDKFCHELCVKRTYSIPYVSAQNPYAERTWGDLLRKTRICFAESNANELFWPEVIKHAATIHNVICDDQCSSPYQRLHGEHYDYNRLHVVLCLCYYLVPDRDRASKLSPRALHATYLGPDPERQGHLVYVHALQRYTSAYHVIFNENRYYNKGLGSQVTFKDAADPYKPNDSIGQRMRSYREERDPDNNTETRPATPEPNHIPTDHQDIRPANDPVHGTLGDGAKEPGAWNENHCEHSSCTFPKGHSGPCSHQMVYGPRNRSQTARLYAECSESDCTFHVDHCGICKDEHGHSLQQTDSYDRLPYEDPESVVDLDPMESSFSMVIDDVVEQTIRVNLVDFQAIPEPKSYADTQKSPLKARWDESMREEWEALLKNDTFETVSRFDKRVRGRRPTKSRWVYKIKIARDGTIERFKSRFVVCGYSQRHGVDYDRSFSATLRATSFRTLLSIAAGEQLRLMHFDVSNAFTQANMDDHEVFIEPPKGKETYETVKGKVFSKLLLLKRALYGTKQASRLWQNTLCEFLLSYGFERSTADPCVFRLSHDDNKIILGIYVDDIIIAYRGNAFFSKFQAAFFGRFPGKPEKLSWFLGMAIDQHEDYTIHLNHELAISKLAEKWIPNNYVTRDCPTPAAFAKLEKALDDMERAKVKQTDYASLVGALLYISVMSRPDIAMHTSLLAKFLSDPSPECVDAAIVLLQYLHSTKKKRLHYAGKPHVPSGLEKNAQDIIGNSGFVAFSDSSWGNKYPYPMFGYSVYLFGSLVSFASKQLKTVAFSSCEAEYAAASFACKEIEFVRQICRDMGVDLHGRLVLGVDNTACIDIAHDVGVSGRTKHYDRAIHYLRDLTQMRRVLPTYVNTHQQLADGFTKVLDKSTFTKWVAHLLS